MLRPALLCLALLPLGACTSIHTLPRPDRVEREPDDGGDLLLETFHFSDHSSHTLTVIAGPEVEAVWFVRGSAGDVNMDGSRESWILYARDRENREHALATVVAEEPTGLTLHHEHGGGSTRVVAVTVGGMLLGGEDQHVYTSGSPAYALRELRAALRRQQQPPPPAPDAEPAPPREPARDVPR